MQVVFCLTLLARLILFLPHSRGADHLPGVFPRALIHLGGCRFHEPLEDRVPREFQQDLQNDPGRVSAQVWAHIFELGRGNAGTVLLWGSDPYIRRSRYTEPMVSEHRAYETAGGTTFTKTDCSLGNQFPQTFLRVPGFLEIFTVEGAFALVDDDFGDAFFVNLLLMFVFLGCPEPVEKAGAIC